MLRARPDRFFYPPYVGKGGWIGDDWALSAPKWLYRPIR
jgi:hypothetical protein